MTDERRGQTSASNAHADSLCPGRHGAQRGLPEETTEYAESGQVIHEALAKKDGETTAHKLSLADREVFDACRSLEKKLCIDYFGEQPPAPMRVSRETRLWVKFAKMDGHALRDYEHSGQPDVVFRSGTKALICEYKCGHVEVGESPMNLQLRDQAVLVSGNLTLLDEIATAVIQPAVTMDPQITVYDKDAIERARIEMYERVIASNQPNAPRIPGEVQCQFCKARNGHCAQYQAWAGRLMPVQMLTVMEVPMASWTAEQRSLVTSGIAPALKFIEELKAFMKNGIKADPSFCPGWELRPGNRVETITDPQKCLDRFATLGGKLEDFMPAVKVGKGALKEAIHKVSGKKGKALEEALKSITDGIVVVTQNEPSLKPVKGNGDV